MENQISNYLLDLNIRALTAFSLILIAALLTYIAFFKKNVDRAGKLSNSRK